MARGQNQKLKLLYLAKIFMEETDETHGLSITELINRLDSYNIDAERKTLYNDFEDLRTFGLDIMAAHEGRRYSYYLASRKFELAELKLLVDSVQSSKFITEKKSRQLIKKLESLVSKHDAGKLQRQVIISGRVKTMNESIYYNVDKIHDAINQNWQIKFKYFQWNMDKKPEYRHNNRWYILSPWHLRWDDENYYLIAYDPEADKLKHYRVDKMKSISTVEIPREGQELMENLDASVYTKRLFGMYGGDPVRVTIEGTAPMVGVIIDRFGSDIPIIKLDDSHFRAYVDVAASPQFYGWIAGLSPEIRITGPDSVISGMQRLAETLNNQYGDKH